jgi:hypothetical protein
MAARMHGEDPAAMSNPEKEKIQEMTRGKPRQVHAGTEEIVFSVPGFLAS